MYSVLGSLNFVLLDICQQTVLTTKSGSIALVERILFLLDKTSCNRDTSFSKSIDMTKIPSGIKRISASVLFSIILFSSIVSIYENSMLNFDISHSKLKEIRPLRRKDNGYIIQISLADLELPSNIVFYYISVIFRTYLIGNFWRNSQLHYPLWLLYLHRCLVDSQCYLLVLPMIIICNHWDVSN